MYYELMDKHNYILYIIKSIINNHQYATPSPKGTYKSQKVTIYLAPNEKSYMSQMP